MDNSWAKGKLSSGLSSTQLKIIAMVLMLVDHIGAFLLTQQDRFYPIYRAIGRLAFPIFCFLIVQGMTHTRSVPKYIARLTVFAFISTPPYNLVHKDNWYSLENMNIFFTLLLGAIAISFLKHLEHDVFKAIHNRRSIKSKIACALIGLMFCLSLCFIAYVLNTDYGGYGVAAIIILWLFKKRPLAAWGIFAMLTFVCYDFELIISDGSSLVQLSMNPYYMIVRRVWEENCKLVLVNARQMLAPLAAVPCAFYNGQRGRILPSKFRYEKYIFYAFYPLHLIIIWVIQICIS